MSMLAASPWSAEQQEWLQAMGLQVLMPASSAGETVGWAGKPSDSVADKALGLSAQPTASTLLDSPLLRALARAAGRASQDAEFLRALPDLTTLRRNPVARRALWPRLRALRVGGAEAPPTGGDEA